MLSTSPKPGTSEEHPAVESDQLPDLREDESELPNYGLMVSSENNHFGLTACVRLLESTSETIAVAWNFLCQSGDAAF